MGTYGLLAVAFLIPTAAGYTVVAIRRAIRWRDEHRAPLPGHSLARLGADLRRLHAQLDEAEFARAVPGKHTRRDAIRAAYVDTLITVAGRLGVSPPAPAAGKVSQAEIYRVEAELRAHGIDVRSPAQPKG